MDLGAYAQIGNLEHIMKENGIYVPRLRGIRLMAAEEPISAETIAEDAKVEGLYRCEKACMTGFKYDPNGFTYSSATNRLKHKYLIYDEYTPVDIRWDKVHGKKRKLFKYCMKKAKRKISENLAVFNKYCGRHDVLYIHARIGGGNWPYYCSEVKDQPWFIEKVDDPFDSTYCDIYARIKEYD